jgi:glycosyltransferase involved in cell wall biosynthesis
LIEKRSALDLDQHVIFLYEHGEKGQPLHASDQMIAELYRLADVLIFPSKREGFGIPILEAGLSRLPVFAADIPPIQESSAGNVQFFDPLNRAPSAVANQIAEYLNSNREFQLRKRVLLTYTWQEIVDQKILPLFNKIAQNESKKED